MWSLQNKSRRFKFITLFAKRVNTTAVIKWPDLVTITKFRTEAADFL